VRRGVGFCEGLPLLKELGVLGHSNGRRPGGLHLEGSRESRHITTWMLFLEANGREGVFEQKEDGVD